MINQLAFNAFLFLVGHMVLLLGTRLPLHLRNAMAFLTGVAVWAIVLTTMTFCFLPLRHATILPALALVLSGLAWFRRNALRISVVKEVTWFVLYIAGLLVATTVAYYGNRTILTPDSFKFAGLGLTIARSGGFPPSGMDQDAVLYLLISRMSFVPLVWAGACMWGIDFYHSLFPVTAVSFVLCLIHFVRMGTEEVDLPAWSKWGLGFLGGAFLASVPSFWHHAHYFHTHLLTAAYYTAAMFFIWQYRSQGHISWMVLAGLALGVTPLIRLALLQFSVIPVVMLLSCKGLKRSDYITFLVVFLAVPFLFQLYKIKWSGLGQYHHQSGGVQIVIYFIYAATYVAVHFRVIQKHLASRAPELLISLLVLLVFGNLFIHQKETISAAAGLLQIIASPQGCIEGGSWGLVWLVVGLFAFPCLFFNRNTDALWWLKPVVIFFLIRHLLYCVGWFFESPHIEQFNAGNRLIVHILPCAVLFVIYALTALCAQAVHGDVDLADEAAS